MSAIAFIQSAIKVRERLLTMGKSKKSDGLVLDKLKRIKQWYSFWKPTEKQASSFVVANADDFRIIIPGDGSTLHKKMMDQLEEIIQSN